MRPLLPRLLVTAAATVPVPIVAAAVFAAQLLHAGATPLPQPGAGAAGADPSDRGRYVQLLARKRRAERLAASLKIEADLSAKRKAYLVLDASARKLYFKVRGRTLKAISLDAIEVAHRRHRIDPDELAGRAYVLHLKEGKGVETESLALKTLTPEEAALAGAKDADVEQDLTEQGEVSEGPAPAERTAGTGAPPATQKMAGVAGGSIPPDPPPRYHLGFDGDLSIWVVADAHPENRNRMYDRILPLAKAIGRWLVSEERERNAVRIELHVTPDRGRQIFRQLIVGQQLLIVP